MGSTWVSTNKGWLKWDIPFISNKPDMAWHQFVPGVVTMVVTSIKSKGCNGNLKNINSIMAVSHYKSAPDKTAEMTEKNRYFPLLRGTVDVPAVGDPVLLCTFGDTQYYLGPLNTDGSPTHNVDHLMASTNLSENNFSKSSEENMSARLEKKYNESLDNPYNEKTSLRNIQGDLVFEGRYGNSIRIGSRDIKPCVIISNGRFLKYPVETTFDGSILGMFQQGSIRQHFSSDSKIENNNNIPLSFILASDNIDGEEERKRLMSTLISNVNDNGDATKIIYDYGKSLTVEEIKAGEELNILGSQMFLNSDRITINSKNDSLFLSSAKNVHIGSKNTLTISTEKETIIESSNIYLGSQAKETAPSHIVGAEVQQGMVLGENLREWLVALVDLLVSTNGHCQGAPIPLGSENGPPGSLIPKLIELKQLIIKDSNGIVSTKHFIEDNEER
jgi:hypothetical protein